jgi:hypothetical protein
MNEMKIDEKSDKSEDEKRKDLTKRLLRTKD